MSPEKFLPYMEQIGFLNQLDQCVVELMCHDIGSIDSHVHYHWMR